MRSFFRVFFIGLLLLPFSSKAQLFSVDIYTVENGLPVDISKAVAQDEDGYVWIASDAGFVRYDGQNFTTFSDNLPSPFTKGFLTTNTGQLFGIHDFGISKIEAGVVPAITPFLKGAKSFTDTTVIYPKALFQDSENRFWVSEYSSLVKYQNGILKRYPFPTKDKSDSFLRSFIVFESSDGTIWATTQTGSIFFLNESLDRLEEVEQDYENIGIINHVTQLGKDQFLLGSSNGLFKLSVSDNGKINNLTLLHSHTDVSSCLQIGEGEFLFGTWNDGLFHFTNGSKRKGKASKISNLSFKNINGISKDKAGSFWVSSESGIAILRPSILRSVKLENFDKQPFIESISYCKKSLQSHYITSKEAIYKVDFSNGIPVQKKIYSDPNAYFLSVATLGDKLWVSSKNSIYYFEKDQLKKVKEFTRNEAYVFFIAADEDGNLWVTQDNINGLFCIISDGEIKRYDEEKGLNTEIDVVKIGNNGSVYASSNGGDDFLFILNKKADQFEKIKASKEGKINFFIKDFLAEDNDHFWLGTNKGLFEIKDEQLLHHDLSQFLSNPEIRGIDLLDKDHLLLATQKGIGIFGLEDKTMSFLDESVGLPGKTIQYRALHKAETGEIWVGTSNGLAILPLHEFEIRKTQAPIFSSTRINQKEFNLSKEGNRIPFHSFLETKVNALVYPSKDLLYQFRINGEDWSTPSKNPQFHLPNLPKGNLTLEARALQKGAFSWSDSSRIQFSVEQSKYLKWWAWLFYLSGLFGLIYLTFKLTERYSKQQQLKLEKLVESRTENLQSAILKQKEVERALRQNEEKYRLLFSSANDGILFFDDINGILDCNDSICRMLGYTKAELLGNQPTILNPILQADGKTSSEKEEDFLKVIYREKSYFTSWQYLKKDGSILDAEVSYNVLNLGGLTFIQSVIRDVSERIKDKKNLAENLAELDRKNQELNKYIESNLELENFAYIASHDLREPLRSIIGFSQLLQSRYINQLDEKAQSYFNYVINSTHNMDRMITDLLEYSRINKSQPTFQKINTQALINLTIELLDQKIKETNAVIQIDSFPEEIIGSRPKLSRVLLNLISNALKFHDISKGVPTITISGKKEGDYFLFSVADNGIGIEKEHFERIFLLFKKLHNKTKFEGTGLGLAISKKIIEQHHGKIWVQSTLGEGTTFYFTLSSKLLITEKEDSLLKNLFKQLEDSDN